MNRSIIRTTQLVLVVGLAVCAAFGQKVVPAADKYKISAKAGMINHSEGLTSVTRLDGTTETLISGDHLNAGDKVVTSSGGIAEVLLNPGSYLRLGSESEFSFRVTSLDDLRLEIKRGSAILEVFASNQFRVTAYTPKGRVTIVNTGVYRIDVASDGSGLLSVIEGKAIVGERNIALIKDGQTGTLDGGAVTVGKFDKGKRDGLASWSRTRSKDLAKMASAFNAKNTRPLIMDSLVNSYSSGLWGRSRTMGIWVFDPISRMCLFMPFYSDWASPYGYGYNACTCNYYFPPNIRPVDPPTRLDGRKPWLDGRKPYDTELGNGNGGPRNSNSKGVDFGTPAKEPVIFSPPPPPPVYSLPTKKPIDH